MDRIIMEDDAGVMAAALPEERRASRLKFDNILGCNYYSLTLFFFIVGGIIIVICILLLIDAVGLHKRSEECGREK
jgi:hypothetical protein